MLTNIEFYNTPGGDVACKQVDQAMFILNESHTDIIENMLSVINELWPDAFKCLSEIYSKSSMNKRYYEYLMIHRFVRCNFGAYDTQQLDIDSFGTWNFEQVPCPLRGECKFEYMLCNPKMKTKLSDRETEIAMLLCTKTPEEIASDNSISLRTVYNHINNIKIRLKVRTIGQIVSWYKSIEHDVKTVF